MNHLLKVSKQLLSLHVFSVQDPIRVNTWDKLGEYPSIVLGCEEPGNVEAQKSLKMSLWHKVFAHNNQNLKNYRSTHDKHMLKIWLNST